MTQHKERPILFSAPMVRAIREGRKTQTRRILKQQPEVVTDRQIKPFVGEATTLLRLLYQNGKRCPYGQPGDRLWVRESFQFFCADHDYQGRMMTSPGHGAAWGQHWRVGYRADGELDRCPACCLGWRPSIHMPRWASRITLEVASVRVERLNDISEEDAKAEGVFATPYGSYAASAAAAALGFVDLKATVAFRYLWESINGPGSWEANPWVWVVEFWEVQP